MENPDHRVEKQMIHREHTLHIGRGVLSRQPSEG